MRHIFMLVLFVFGTIGNAQSVEERLTLCIEESQQIIAHARAWREGLERMGQTPKAWEFANILTALETASVVDQMITQLPDESLSRSDLRGAYSSALEPIKIRNTLLEEMVSEAFKERPRYEALAEYIARCSDNFGGITYTLQDEVAKLQSLVTALQDKIQSEAVFYLDTIKDLEEENRALQKSAEQLSKLDLYVKRAETLCIWMKTYNHLDVVEKEVFLYGKTYDLCE